MEEHVIVDSSFSAVINAPLEKIDIPAWCFSLPDEEYQGCSPAHFAAGASKARDGRRMSINVEVIGGSLMVQHYVEAVAERHHLVLDSVSDLFTTAGRTKILVMWELSVKRMDAGSASSRVTCAHALPMSSGISLRGRASPSTCSALNVSL